jgi:hypothetical protein
VFVCWPTGTEGLTTEAPNKIILSAAKKESEKGFWKAQKIKKMIENTIATTWVTVAKLTAACFASSALRSRKPKRGKTFVGGVAIRSPSSRGQSPPENMDYRASYT